MTEDEVIYSVAYDEGYIDGMDFARSQIDAAAFGAIRRAAEYARYHDQRADDWERNGVEDIANTWAFAAISIRLAIRAAIGAEKV